MVLLLHYVQSLPCTKPDLVQPSLDKLDITKLKSHASHYRVKCGLSETAQQWWNEELVALEEFVVGYEGLNNKPEWCVDTLITPPLILSESNVSTAIHPSVQLLNQVPEHLSRLTHIESQPFPKVRNFAPIHNMHKI